MAFAAKQEADESWKLLEQQPSGKWRPFESGLDEEELADAVRELIDDSDLDPGEPVLIQLHTGLRTRKPAAYLLRPDEMREVGFVIGAQPIKGQRPDQA